MPDSVELYVTRQSANLIPADMRCLFFREKVEFWWKTAVVIFSIKPSKNMFCLFFLDEVWVWWETAINQFSIKLTKNLRCLFADFLYQTANGYDLLHQNEHQVWWKNKNCPVSIKLVESRASKTWQKWARDLMENGISPIFHQNDTPGPAKHRFKWDKPVRNKINKAHMPCRQGSISGQ